MRIIKLFYMKDKIQVTMMKRPTTPNSMKSNLLKVFRSSFLLLLITLISINNFASVNTTKNITDSNIIELHINFETGDDIKNVKISMPDTKLFRRADREMNRNMAKEIRDLKNFRLIQPESVNGDFEINNEFYEQYKLVNFYLINQYQDDKITSEFHAYNLNNNFTKYANISDNELNITFIESYKINPAIEFNTSDDEMNFNFYASNI